MRRSPAADLPRSSLGRRVGAAAGRRHPWTGQGSPAAQTYGYDLATGLLDTTVDADGRSNLATFGISYDGASRLKSKYLNGAPFETNSYDADGRLIGRTVGWASTSLGVANIYDDAIVRDPAGRATATRTHSDILLVDDSTTAVYNGLGALAAFIRTPFNASNVVTVDQFVPDAFGNRAADSHWGADLGFSQHTYNYGFDRIAASNFVPPSWSVGQPDPKPRTGDNANYDADASGNTVGELHLPVQFFGVDTMPYGPRLNGREWDWNVYGADERLRVSQHSFLDSTVAPEATLRTVFIENRYDALGRRVLTESRWDSH